MHSANFIKSILCLLVIAFLTLPAHGKVAPVALEDLIKQSDVILLGKVSSIHRIGDVDFAEVEVLEMLKGEQRLKIVYSAERTWPCDISGAVNAETALFFFTTYKFGPTFRRNAEQTILLRESAAGFFHTNDLFRLSFDGRGRMPMVISGNDKSLSISPGVRLPKGLNPTLSEIVEFSSKVIADS
jgi:hypothetical protein